LEINDKSLIERFTPSFQLTVIVTDFCRSFGGGEGFARMETVQFLLKIIPVDAIVSASVAILSQGVTLNSSNLSWANVAASVIWFPNELFFVVVTINPAKANNEIAKITKAISTSIKEKPFDFAESLKMLPPEMVLKWYYANPIPIDLKI
jgi:hypothetical protein